MNIPDPLAKAVSEIMEFVAAGLPLALLAALGGVVRSMQAGRCGLKAVCVAACSATFAGLIAHLILSQTSWPLSIQAALCGLTGYASGELLKIAAVRMCKWAETVAPPVAGGGK